MSSGSMCGHCRWWNATYRTEGTVEYGEAECRKRAPFPAAANSVQRREYPMTKGMDGCGDFAHAGPEVYREDYREKLGPWISTTVLWGPRP